MNRKSIVVLTGVCALSFLLAACNLFQGRGETASGAVSAGKRDVAPADSASPDADTADSAAADIASVAEKQPVALKFMFWGSAAEKQALDTMVARFEVSHPSVTVDAQYVPGDYMAKMNELMAGNALPDVAYLAEGLALKWAEEGKLMDLTPLLAQDSEFKNRLPQTFYYFAPGKTLGTSTTAGIIDLFYNKSLFDEAGISYPPASAEKAWTWDEFVRTAQRLTKDSNGKHPTEAGFDADRIVQFGVSLPTTFLGWYPLLRSNGADITDDEGTKYTLNRPEAVEVFQNIRDLMYTYHVAPHAAQQANMPSSVAALQTGKAAMAIDGQWSVRDYAASKLNFGIGVLPKLQQARTMILGTPTVVFAGTKHPREAIEFYLYHNNPEAVNLYQKGLWMPVELKYYQDPSYIEAWTKNAAHPAEYREAAIDYTLHDTVQSPSYRLKNWSAIEPKINAGLNLIWSDQKPVKQELDELETVIQPMLQGKYPDS